MLDKIVRLVCTLTVEVQAAVVTDDSVLDQLVNTAYDVQFRLEGLSYRAVPTALYGVLYVSTLGIFGHCFQQEGVHTQVGAAKTAAFSLPCHRMD